MLPSSKGDAVGRPEKEEDRSFDTLMARYSEPVCLSTRCLLPIFDDDALHYDAYVMVYPC